MSQRQVSLAVETAATQTKPTYVGYKIIDFSLVYAGRLGLCSHEFHEAVGELAEGQAPQGKPWKER